MAAPSSSAAAPPAGPKSSSHAYVDHRIGSTVFSVHPRYVDLKPIGRGAYGLVCGARDTLSGRSVAIKKLTRVFGDLVNFVSGGRGVYLAEHATHLSRVFFLTLW
jgi:hypothetical protein